MAPRNRHCVDRVDGLRHLLCLMLYVLCRAFVCSWPNGRSYQWASGPEVNGHNGLPPPSDTATSKKAMFHDI